METIDRIPITKIQRASKLVVTGAKVGVNYVKYYKDKIVSDQETAQRNLDTNNANDIYDGLKNLKGSALKMAQMLSMDKSVLPQAYVEKFSLSQFSVPPLSPALVVKTFKKYFGKSPGEIFDKFDSSAIQAASIGQVHKATLKSKDLAVKIQYPGVADSIKSDLAMVKPIAMSMFNIPSKGSEKYFKEVENKLMEETDYLMEIEQSISISKACEKLPNLLFPKYYPELSSNRIITMDWMSGRHLSDFTKANDDKDSGQLVGQTLWDFYMYQFHYLKKVHADPHPGNFLVSESNELIALDFGCMKDIPENFYTPYFELASSKVFENKDVFHEKLLQLEMLKSTDSVSETEMFTEMFYEMLKLFTRPLSGDYFDFSDATFFDEIAQLGEKFSKNTELFKADASRGSEHFIYMNRTFFGLYNLMFDLKAENVKINNYQNYIA
ncbi:MAG: putative unusual protein kinase regulating ubiquinone biosynthesis (AarF/ABC1/UbiB family) [Salibacteraceae bacterium]|jgi:predicted unusual protein kinase regulating ubiquinone biosynthesis (AarF/ABC1/UbiB family)